MKYKLIVLAAIIFSMLFSCENNDQSSEIDVPFSGHKITVNEVIQGSSYTYLRVSEGDAEYWIATGRQEFNEDDVLYYLQGLEMKNFESKELGKTFETLLMVQSLSTQPTAKPTMPTGNVQGQRPNLTKEDLSIDAVEGGTSIGELYKNPKDHASKTVVVRGKVVKYNAEIMGKNWVHIQDGTGDENSFDLTVTTKENVAVGDIVTFKGVFFVNRDFGAGYTYDIILENATIVK